MNFHRFLLISISFFLLSALRADAALIIQAPTYLGLTSGLVGYWSFDGNDTIAQGRKFRAFDRSGQGNSGYVFNATSTTGGAPTVIGRIGQALEFDGSNDYVDIGAGPTSVNSISFWVYPKTTTEYFVNLTGTTDYIWANAGTVTATAVASPTIYVNGLVSSSLSANQWQHVVVTTATAENASNLDIGRTQDLNSMEGLIDEVRVYDRELSADEVRRLYKIGSTFKVKAPDDTGLVGYWKLNEGQGTAVGDSSGNNYSGILVDMDASSDWVSSGAGIRGKGFGTALDFDGSNDELNIGDGASLNVQGIELTLSVWVNSGVSNSSEDYIFYKLNGTNGGYFLRRGNLASQDVEFMIVTNGQKIVALDYDAIWDGRWHHLVGVYDGTLMRIYIDGVQRTTLAETGTIGSSSGVAFRVGGNSTTGDFFIGKLDELRVYKQALTPTAVLELYNQQAPAKINASSVGKITEGLVGYWSFDGPDMFGTKASDRSGQGNNGTLTNMDTSTDLVIGKIGQALEFDGSNDEVKMDSLVNNINYSAGTMSAWVKFDASETTDGQDHGVVGIAGTTGENGFIRLWIRGEGVNPDTMQMAYRPSGVGSMQATDSDLTSYADTWRHVVGVWDADNIYFYKDGKLIDSTARTSTASGLDHGRIGAEGQSGTSAQFAEAVIDDVRVYNRALSADEVKRLYNMGR